MDMIVKGTAVASVPLFVKNKFPNQYDKWLQSLPPKSREIMERCLVSTWYLPNDAILVPTQKICEILYNNNEKGAWEGGRFSSENALKGIYKFFIRIGTPGFIIKRAGMVFSAYYKPAKMEVIQNQKGMTVVHISDFTPSHRLLELRIGGWMQRSLELSGCKNANVKITKSPTQGHSVVEYVLKWS